MDHPGLGPGGPGEGQVGTALLERGSQLAAHELGQGLDRDEKGLARRVPVVAVSGDAATGDQAVNVGVIDELLGPGVQDSEHADHAADMAWIAGELDDGVGGGLHQKA